MKDGKDRVIVQWLTSLSEWPGFFYGDWYKITVLMILMQRVVVTLKLGYGRPVKGMQSSGS